MNCTYLETDEKCLGAHSLSQFCTALAKTLEARKIIKDRDFILAHSFRDTEVHKDGTNILLASREAMWWFSSWLANRKRKKFCVEQGTWERKGRSLRRLFPGEQAILEVIRPVLPE